MDIFSEIAKMFHLLEVMVLKSVILPRFLMLEIDPYCFFVFYKVLLFPENNMYFVMENIINLS